MLPLKFLSDTLKELSPDFGATVSDDLDLFREYASNLFEKRSIPKALEETAVSSSALGIERFSNRFEAYSLKRSKSSETVAPKSGDNSLSVSLKNLRGSINFACMIYASA